MSQCGGIPGGTAWQLHLADGALRQREVIYSESPTLKQSWVQDSNLQNLRAMSKHLGLTWAQRQGKARFAQILTQSVCSGQKLLLVIDSLWEQKELLDFRVHLPNQYRASNTYLHVLFKLGGSLGIPKLGFLFASLLVWWMSSSW